MPDIADVDVEDRFKYDKQYSLALWKRVLAEEASLDEFMFYIKRFVVICLRRTKMQYRDLDAKQEIVHYGLLAVWQAAASKNIPDTTLGRFHGYLWGTIRNGFCDAVAAGLLEPEIIHYDDAKIHMSRYLKRVASSRDVEDRLFLEELPGVVKKKVEETIRFPDLRPAVGYVVDRIFHGEDVSDSWLKNNYGVRDSKFFTDHVRIRVKMALVDMQRDMEFPSDRSHEAAVYGPPETEGES